MKYFFVGVFLFFSSLYSQTSYPCGFDDMLKEVNLKHPGAKERLDAGIQAKSKFAKFKRRASSLDTTYEIRVVFHVIYNMASQNIPDSCLISQLEILNQGFSHTHKDSGNVVPYFKPFIGKANLVFKFATEDPNGLPTNGITRTVTNVMSFGNKVNEIKYNSLGGKDAWDSDKYLNIWIGNFEINSTALLLGIATPPNNHPFWNGTGNEDIVKEEQGICLHFRIVGRNNPSFRPTPGQDNKGEVVIHEAGHYLGLRHIWGDANNVNACSVDDFIDDTPLQRSSSLFTCNLNRNTCNSGANDATDNVENYMDYSSEQCYKMFTKKQIDVMLLSLITSRKGIISKKSTDLKVKTENIPVFRWNNGDLVFLNDETNSFKIKMYDMAGRLVYMNLDLKTLDLHYFKGLAKGTYIVKFTKKLDLNSTITQKIIL